MSEYFWIAYDEANEYVSSGTRHQLAFPEQVLLSDLKREAWRQGYSVVVTRISRTESVRVLDYTNNGKAQS